MAFKGIEMGLLGPWGIDLCFAGLSHDMCSFDMGYKYV
uniref:Uncharacterized protein n=1 Tax=Rhizophora mucronata TaxID=61149 RepID=A0A2P2R2S6_RHIMU